MSQRKSSGARRGQVVAPLKRPRKRPPNKTKWWILILLVPAIVLFIYSSIPQSTKAVSGPQFSKEGELTIQRDGEQLAAIDIEIADTDADITQGLMYRQSMEEEQGMLFLMPETDYQSFWMLNTDIPLDIIFIGEDKRIINVRANTTPRSLDPVASTAPARYVLEVNAGYARRKGLRAGDLLNWRRQ